MFDMPLVPTSHHNASRPQSPLPIMPLVATPHQLPHTPDCSEPTLTPLLRGVRLSAPATLRDFQSRVQLDFAGPGPYPPTVLPQPTSAPFSHQSTGNNINSSTGSSIPAFASHVPLSKDAPVIPSPSIRTYPSSPPDTPEASHSASTSPASSVSPQTPPNAHGAGFVKLVSADSSPVEAPVIPHSHGSTMLGKPVKAVASAAPTSSAVAPKKPKTVRGQFAYATRAVWQTALSLWCSIFFFPFSVSRFLT